MARSAEQRIPLVESARRLIEFLAERSFERMLILAHDYPDPDALAAAFGLRQLAAAVAGTESRIVHGGVIGRTENREMVQILKIPVHRYRASDLKKYPHVALVDTQPGFENNPFPHNRRATLVIDQHASTGTLSADLALVDPKCGATCVILARALLMREDEIPARLATALAYGILSDTLELYRARDPEVVRAYLDVLPFSDMRALARIRNPSRPRGFFVTLARGIRQAQAFRGLVVSHLGNVANPDLIAQMADALLTYRLSRWVLCTGRYKGKLCVSLRTTRRNVEAGEVLRAVFERPQDAGGHGSIAGGAFKVGREPTEEAWREAELGVQSRLGRRLRLPATGKFRNLFREQGD